MRRLPLKAAVLTKSILGPYGVPLDPKTVCVPDLEGLCLGVWDASSSRQVEGKKFFGIALDLRTPAKREALERVCAAFSKSTVEGFKLLNKFGVPVTSNELVTKPGMEFVWTFPDGSKYVNPLPAEFARAMNRPAVKPQWKVYGLDLWSPSWSKYRWRGEALTT